MPLAPSTRLGPYEILSPLGAGGMGEVYRARDPRMERDVAIKICAERFSDRFEREVHAVAALNHPNICHIYDVGPNYLVLELVEGPTLADRIKGGALPLEEALTIARQIADALEAAHEKGIIHRDLKPGNVKITPEGVVKVLDFGLAKVAQTSACEDPEASPTLTMQGTAAGQILGTAAYMSPEQARGRTVDKRADIWAFGVVLFEMLTGPRLFHGETISDTLVAVLREAPDFSRVPRKAQRLLKSCLEKDPKRRLRDIGDAWRFLDDLPVQPFHTTKIPWVIAGLATVLAIVALWALWRGGARTSGQRPVRLDLDLGADVSLGSSLGPAVILSPDGARLVFVSEGQDGIHRLFTRRLDQAKAAEIPHTDGASEPFFSPDGQWVGFFAGGKLKKTRIDGGEPVSLCDAPSARGASWGEDGSIIVALESQTGLSQVPPEGGKATQVTDLLPGEVSHRWPQVLPGGKTVVYNRGTGYGNFEEAEIAVVSLKDLRTKTVHTGMYPRYLPSGHLLYIRKGALFAVPFDPDRLELRGPAALLLDDVSSDANLGTAQIAFSRDGMIAYRSGRTEARRTVQWLSAAGKTESLLPEPGFYLFPRLSPDGSQLALLRVTPGSGPDMWVYDLERGIKVRLTNGTALSSWPVWSSDGQHVIFQATGGMFWARADGAGEPRPLTHSKTLQFPASFTPDGTRLAYTELISGTAAEIRTVSVESGSGQLRARQPQTFLKIATANAYPAFSPDGRWLAYASSEGGIYEVYVRAFPDNGTRVQISNAGGVMPVWSRNGHELFYRNEDQRIMVVNYKVKGESFTADKPRVWSEKRLANLGLTINFDLASDGKRFVVLMPADGVQPHESQSHVTLVVNFFDEIRSRLAGQSK